MSSNWLFDIMFVSSWYELVWMLVAGVIYVVISAGMIAFNKYLMHPHHFPYAAAMTVSQMAVCSVTSLALYKMMPWMFPSLPNLWPRGKMQRQQRGPWQQLACVDLAVFKKGVLPIAILNGFQLILSTQAFLHSSVAFLQIMKESNVVWCYILSVFVALEVFSWRKVALIALIICSTLLTLTGEVKFSWAGFATQATSQVFESWKIVLQALLLTQSGFQLDPLSYVLVVMPVCLLTVLLMIGAMSLSSSGAAMLPSAGEVWAWWPMLLSNGIVAFLLNVAIATFMKISSGMGFVLSGILKDAAIMLLSVVFFAAPTSPQQLCGFILQLGSIVAWSRAVAEEKQEKASSPASWKGKSETLPQVIVTDVDDLKKKQRQQEEQRRLQEEQRRMLQQQLQEQEEREGYVRSTVQNAVRQIEALQGENTEPPSKLRLFAGSNQALDYGSVLKGPRLTKQGSGAYLSDLRSERSAATRTTTSSRSSSPCDDDSCDSSAECVI